MYVDIALSLNRTLQVPLLVVINSILRNTYTNTSAQGINPELAPAPLRFNILVPEGDRNFFTEPILTAFADYQATGSAIFRVKEFTPPDSLKHYLDSKFQEKSLNRRLSRYMQYARLFLKDCFPDISRVIYLDCDTLVLGDIRSLFAFGQQLSQKHYLAAVPQLFPAAFYFANPFKMWNELRQFKNTFNSGVLLTDLTYWNEATYDLLTHYLRLDASHHYRLYNLGDETVFNLMFKRSYLPLSKHWNCWGYGQIHLIGRILTLRCPLKNVNILHWSGGHHKPWQSNQVVYSNLWRSYLPNMTSQSAMAVETPAYGISL